MVQPAIEVLISAAEIAARVEVLADEITATLGAEFLAAVVLKGSFVFAADLIRALHRAGATPTVDFMTLASYGSGTQSSGAVSLLHDVTEPLDGRPVLLIDDILESGRTLLFARNHLAARGAGPVKVCVLLDKPHRRAVPIEADFAGFAIGDRFVVGYGLDLAHRYRGVPYIGVVEGG